MKLTRIRGVPPGPRRRATWIAGTLAGVVVAIGFGTAATAHVEVDVEGSAVAGRPAELVFRVPNERDAAATIAIEVQMPQDVDLADVVPATVDGWTVTTTTRDGDVVDTIRWDADGPGLTDGESTALPVSVGPLPAVAELAFPTVQTYDDGEVVRWIEAQTPGGPEPDLPVPVLPIEPAPPGATAAVTEPPTTVAPAPTEPPPPTRADTSPATAPATPPTEPAATPAPTGAPIGTTVDSPLDGLPLTITSTPGPIPDDDGGSAVWPRVLAGVAVVVVAGAAVAIARRRSSP